MNLKSIEMVGFKSFADRTFVDLKGGMTAVVGPNGCGKSNIVDALRWCLGEMSPRSLRSKHMMDVIFAGSSGRTQLNLAEVTLTFDNSYHLLPIDFTEVQVSRRLFRSGESEYFLNKTQCRLKDIRDLFLDTGMAEGYSILAQGEVDFVISSKPEERRELFEEAAGISKYKSRREEALHKLEKVEIDLNRLNDIITMTKEQMDSLESAAKKARTYQEIKEQLKTMELTDYLNRLTDLREKIQISQKRLDELTEQLRQTSVQMDCAESEMTQDRLLQDEYEKEMYKLNSSKMELEKEIGISDQTSRLAQERESEFTEKEKKAKEQIEIFRNELENIQSKVQQIGTELINAQKQEEELKNNFEKEKTVLESFKSEGVKLESEKNKISDQILHIANELTELRNEQNKSSSLIINKEIAVGSLRKEVEKFSKTQNDLDEELNQLNQTLHENESATAFLRDTVVSIEKELVNKKGSKSELENKISVLRHTLIQRETQFSSLLQDFEHHPYRKGTEAVLKQNFTGCRGIVGLLFKYSDHARPWVESVLGNKTDYLVFDCLENAEKALGWLKENQLGRAVCIVLDKIPSVQIPDISSVPNANSLFSFVQCEPELVPLKKYLFGSAFVAGNTLYDTGTIDGGSDLISVGNELRSQNYFYEKEKLQTEIKQYKTEMTQLNQQLSSIESEIIKAEEIRSEKGNVLGKLTLEKNHCEKIVSAKNQELELCGREISIITETCEIQEKEKISLSSAIEEIQIKISALMEKQAKTENEREEFQKKIGENKSEEHRSALIVKENEIRLETFQTGLNKTKESFSEWENHLKENLKRTEDTSKEIEHCRHQIEQNREVQKEESGKIQKYHQEKEKISAQTDEIIGKKTVLEEKNKQKEEALQKIRETQQQISGIAHQVEIELRTQENEEKNILSRMQETYQITPEEIKEKNLIEIKPIDTETLARLKKRVESMSNSVNLEAPEQYQGFQERYNFLTSQLQDLLKAKDDLKNAIQQINATTREQFKETFAKVRENFIKVFSTLFVGGTADLVFTDQHNLLETGIDIIVQPPGKKLQNIALLSGGEKTLTAVALLFAFFMVKPSPFCVLDEVDAPLDPANVSRYLNLLKEFSEKTQFLVVTHNAKTMEMADILYGVTMEESGISKVISVKLKKEGTETRAQLELAAR